MEKFAGYGFNKSHAAAYALLAYQTAYMKAHHAAAFMAANMSAVMDDTDKLRQFRDDALANGLAMLPPDINASGYRFVPVDAKTVRYGLGGVRGTGEAAIEAIVEARKAGPVHRPVRFLPPRRQARGEPALHRGAGARRRLRRRRIRTAPACSPRRGAPSRRPSRPSAPPRRTACSARPTRRTPPGWCWSRRGPGTCASA